MKIKAVKTGSAGKRLTVIAAIVFIAFGSVTVASRSKNESVKRGESAEEKEVSTSVPPNLITVRVGGQEVQVNPQTGQIQKLSPQQAQQLADGLKQMLNRSTDGLVQVRHADGSVSMDLQGRFQNVTVARVNEDGSVSHSCVDNPEAAAHFFGIDPQLMGIESRSGQAMKAVQKNPIQ